MKKIIQAVDVPESELMKLYYDARKAYRDAETTLKHATETIKDAMLKYARAKVGDVVELVENHPTMETLGWHKENTKMTVCKVSVSDDLFIYGAGRPSDDDFKALASYCIQYEGIAVYPDGEVVYPHVIDDDRVLELRKVERVK